MPARDEDSIGPWRYLAASAVVYAITAPKHAGDNECDQAWWFFNSALSLYIGHLNP